jgi:hypothetical protein
VKHAQANQSTIETVTSLVSPQAANIERAGFAVLGVIIHAIDAAGSAAGANGLNVTLAPATGSAISRQLLSPVQERTASSCALCAQSEDACGECRRNYM